MVYPTPAGRIPKPVERPHLFSRVQLGEGRKKSLLEEELERVRVLYRIQVSHDDRDGPVLGVPRDEACALEAGRFPLVIEVGPVHSDRLAGSSNLEIGPDRHSRQCRIPASGAQQVGSRRQPELAPLDDPDPGLVYVEAGELPFQAAVSMLAELAETIQHLCQFL